MTDDNGQRLRILNVDDDPTIRDLIRAILEEDYEILSFPCCEDAIEFLDGEKEPGQLDCIILDVNLPGMSGFDMLTRLKLHTETCEIPVIMVTCQDSPEDFMSGYDSGAEYYITKPFTREQLLYGVDMVTKK